MVTHEKLPDEIISEINNVLSIYLGQDIHTEDISATHDDEEWHFHVSTDWMYNRRGIFEHSISRYCISADVIKHQFDAKDDQYRNGRVYRIYPHIHWEHLDGGSNGHRMQPEMIVIEKVIGRWRASMELR